MKIITTAVAVLVVGSALKLATTHPETQTHAPRATGTPSHRAQGFTLSADKKEFAVEKPFSLAVTMPAKGFLYLFDVSDDAANLIWNHEGDAWDAGEYQTEAVTLYSAGEHELLAVFAPHRLDGVYTWSAVRKNLIEDVCEDCSVSTVNLTLSPAR
jgi:hypothetical protein